MATSAVAKVAKREADNELVLSAEETFLELDRREAADECA